jgi:hypothetical protein
LESVLLASKFGMFIFKFTKENSKISVILSKFH